MVMCCFMLMQILKSHYSKGPSHSEVPLHYTYIEDHCGLKTQVKFCYVSIILNANVMSIQEDSIVRLLAL